MVGKIWFYKLQANWIKRQNQQNNVLENFNIIG